MLVRLGTLVLCAWALTNSAAAQQAPDAQASPSPPAVGVDASFNAGPIKITPGGFLEMTGIFRNRNETADLATSFNSIPFPDNVNHYISETRMTARNSRFSLLAQGPKTDTLGEASAYLETDFLSTGLSSNSVESNGYTLRVRQAFFLWDQPLTGWQVTGGQAWSLATAYKHGLTPRNEDIPVIDEGQYVVGFTWARQTQLRVVKTFTPAVAVGLSIEDPQNVVKGGAPAGTTATNPGGTLLNQNVNYSTDIAPDVVAKLALDPAFGHFEVFSLTRWFRDRAPSVPGVLATTSNHTTTAESLGAALIVPYGKWFDLHASTLIGHGNGRYGSAQLGDSTYNPYDGGLAAIKETQVLVGLIFHPTRDLDLYAYGGYEQQRAAYGLTPASNAACEINPLTPVALPPGAGCGGIGTVRGVAGGFNWRFYHGRLGYIQFGPEVEYLKDTTYPDSTGLQAQTNETVVYLTLRYYPFQ